MHPGTLARRIPVGTRAAQICDLLVHFLSSQVRADRRMGVQWK